MILIRKRECVLTLLWLLAMLPVCAVAADFDYTVRVDETLATLAVTARFSEPVDELSARSRSAPQYLGRAETCDGVALRPDGRRIRSDDLTCIRYTFDLAAAARSERRNASLDRSNVLIATSRWLWRPRLDRADRVNVTFELPDGVIVSPPWQALDESGKRFRVLPSPENASGAVAIGRFVEETRDIPGAKLRIAVMKPRGDRAPVELVDWVESAATNVSLAYGEFPNPLPHAIVVPVGGGRYSGNSPVPFGRVIRDGGETVELYVNQHAALERFYDDWTATHEFSHFMLPYVTSRQRWISEGFAQYFQNVLMARAGSYSAERAWQKLYEGFERGRRSRPELSPNAAASGRQRGATMKVYWSGAVLALMADVELRQTSGGRQSLDSVLGSLMACCLPSARTWTGPELLAELDALAGADVFVPLYERYADQGGFPTWEPVFAELGVSIEGGRVQLDDSTPLAGVRAAIMRPPGDIIAAGSTAPEGPALIE